MVRRFSFLLGFALLSATVPARGQDFFEALSDAIDEAMDDGGYDDDGHSHQHHHHDGYYNNGNYYRPTYPQQQRIWNGTTWEYVPVNPYPSGRVVYPSTTVTSAAVAANALPYKGPGVTIKLEESEGGSVTYLVDGKESATIQAGQQQTLTSKGKFEIRFSRGRSDDGRNFGEARYTLTEGNYSFKVTDKGWELLRDKEQPSLATASPSSPSGIRTNPLPPKTAPAAPAASTVPAPPAAAPAANAVPAPRPAAPAANVVPPPRAAPPTAG